MDAVKFLKEKKRMCESHVCSKCRLHGKCDIADVGFDKMEDIVRTVEEWSKEHPFKTNVQVITDDLIGKNFGEDFKTFYTKRSNTLLLRFRDSNFLFEKYKGKRLEQTEDKLSFKEARELLAEMCGNKSCRECVLFEKTIEGGAGCKIWCFDHPEEAQKIALDWKKKQEKKESDE